jgi:hypothetical protein
MNNMPGLHSYAYAQHDGKLLLVGGRTDGIHARQPFASFPAEKNNKTLFVVDPILKQSWALSILTLPSNISEHLQSTNMNFYQNGDTLYIIGGYAYSATANTHITFPKLTTLIVSEVIEQVISGQLNASSFKQTTDQRFAVTGGQLGKLDDVLLLVGGHRFDGRYNPFGGPTFTQTYTNAIRRFIIDNSGTTPSITYYLEITDTIHLRRRDYNLVPYIFDGGQTGYMISTGVFRSDIDLPFLYPVMIDANNYYPDTSFNQYLSHYHSPKLSIYETANDELHMLFLGGIAQYYFENNLIVQDNLVPFVNTISRVSRIGDSALVEYALPYKMPNLKGASAEFIPNKNLPQNESGVFLMDGIEETEILMGYIVGGINTPSRNPFSTNTTNLTSADTSIYRVLLERNVTTQIKSEEVPTKVQLYQNYPNPFNPTTKIKYSTPENGFISIKIYDVLGREIKALVNEYKGAGIYEIEFEATELPSGTYFYTISGNSYFATQKMILLK